MLVFFLECNEDCACQYHLFLTTVLVSFQEYLQTSSEDIFWTRKIARDWLLTWRTCALRKQDRQSYGEEQSSGMIYSGSQCRSVAKPRSESTSWFLPSHHVEHGHKKECFRNICANCRSSLILENIHLQQGVLPTNLNSPSFCWHCFSLRSKSLRSSPALHSGLSTAC